MTVGYPSAPPRGSRRRSWRRRWLPGDVRVWRAAGAVALLLVAIGTLELLRPREVYTGTNSVRTRSVVIDVPSGRTLCIPGLSIPAGTGRIELEHLEPVPRPPIDASLRIGSSTRYASAPGAPAAGKFTLAFARRPDAPAAAAGTLCVTPRGGNSVLGGVPGLQGDGVPVTLSGESVDVRVSVWFRPPAGEQTTLLELLPELARRASLFRPGWVGPWTYWLLLCLVTPALGYAAVRLLARAAANERGRLSAAAAVALLAFANAAVFATLSPSFQAPDESEHAAYVQLLAETGDKPTVLPGRNAYSTEQTIAIEAVRAFSSNERPDGKPPWLALDEDRWRERAAREAPLARDDGGGPTTPATHRPGYYLAGVPAYLAARDGSFFDSLWAMRLVSALLGAIAAAFTVLFVRELMPRAPLAVPVAAGLLVAFLPQFGFVSGAVNNDNGVNALAAAALYLAARALRRGLSPGTAAALGAVAMLLPLFKATGNALLPALALAVVVALVRHRGRLLGVVALAAGAVAGRAAIYATDRLIDPVPTPGAPAASDALVSAGPVLERVLDDPQLYASYLWQTFLPPLPFMNDLFLPTTPPGYEAYLKEGFAGFGWYAMFFAEWVYKLILVVVVFVVLAALVALWQRRRQLRVRWPEVALVVLAICGVLGGVAAAYMSGTGHLGGQPEQGRYAFVAIAAFAAVAGAALVSVRRGWLAYVAGALVAGMVALEWASQLMLLQRFYS
jgi:Predicted membrane protein (DUF2142)